MKDIHLLERVAIHKSIYFKTAWAKYETAKAGTLRLAPPENRMVELKEDYRAMQPMFFGKAPDFEEIVQRMNALEVQINSLCD